MAPNKFLKTAVGFSYNTHTVCHSINSYSWAFILQQIETKSSEQALQHQHEEGYARKRVKPPTQLVSNSELQLSIDGWQLRVVGVTWWLVHSPKTEINFPVSESRTVSWASASSTPLSFFSGAILCNIYLLDVNDWRKKTTHLLNKIRIIQIRCITL